jgi:hypothetical protein
VPNSIFDSIRLYAFAGYRSFCVCVLAARMNVTSRVSLYASCFSQVERRNPLSVIYLCTFATLSRSYSVKRGSMEETTRSVPKLYTWAPLGQTHASASPFGGKIELALRMAGIEYTVAPADPTNTKTCVKQKVSCIPAAQPLPLIIACTLACT